MSTVIRVENISKLYRLGEIGTGSLAHDVNRWWHKVRGKEDPYLKIGQTNDRTRKAESGKQKTETGSEGKARNKFQLPAFNSQLSTASPDYVYALKDVSFEVNQGEVLGIIGRNGAGKSTLLKILSRVTTPTTGEIKAKGRIASLLEVGTGFHPELSGRDNIYLNGAILGMRKHEIASKFDEIVDFSGCERYIDTPVKRYSSGMYVRLAFAVAAHLEPEILIVDEVLAVGDAEFQKKCLGKMKDVAGQGRTVLFVSHNMAAVKSLCSRAIRMSNGNVVANGDTESVLKGYLSSEFTEALSKSWEIPNTSIDYERHGIYLKQARLLYDTDKHDLLSVNTPFSLQFCVNSRSADQINLSPHYLGPAGEIIFAAPSPTVAIAPGDNWFTCQIPGDLLNDGIYSLMLMIVKNAVPLDIVNDALTFEIHEPTREGTWFGKWPGVIRPKFDWTFSSEV